MRRFLIGWAGVILIGAMLAGCKRQQHTVEYYEEKAETDFNNEEYDLALRDLNKAIQLVPRNGYYYFLRAQSQRNLYNFHSALADFDQALAYNPGQPFWMAERGFTKFQLNDVSGALEDLNTSIQTAPQYTFGYNSRGFIRLAQKDYIGAESDFTTSILLDSKDEQGYFNRAILNTVLGLSEQALADYKKTIDSPEPNQNTNYSYLMTWILRAQKGEADQASVELSHQVVDNWTSDAWSKNVVSFLVGEITEKEFLNRAAQGPIVKTHGQFCEVWYYIGMKRLLAKNLFGAEQAFKKCLDSKRVDYTEYHLASSELDRMSRAALSVPKPVPHLPVVPAHH